ncbi:hypothetical protein BT93_B3202 [Corymbia citriodora subsp. variegata]|nr:hypothetical protein BT93_B3202 [Corymbia citriodora subsp. variegata]
MENPSPSLSLSLDLSLDSRFFGLRSNRSFHFPATLRREKGEIATASCPFLLRRSADALDVARTLSRLAPRCFSLKAPTIVATLDDNASACMITRASSPRIEPSPATSGTDAAPCRDGAERKAMNRTPDEAL